jgi:hypothetical protein
MPVVLRTKRSATTGTTPSNLELGELAVNIPDKKIWIGDGTATPALIGDYNAAAGQYYAGNGIAIDGSNNISLDLSAVDEPEVNFTAANEMNFQAGNATISGIRGIVADSNGNIYITGNLIVSGYLETDVGVRGGTDAELEYLGENMVMDGGTF